GENTWDIGNFDSDVVLDGVNDGVVTATDFSLEFIDFHTLVGGSGNDHFNFATENPGRITGSVNGRGGSENRITGRDSSSRWLIDSASGVSIAEGSTSYLAAASNIQILAGGSGEDLFEIKSGDIRTILGGAGNDRFEFAENGLVTTVDGQEGEDTLVGRNSDNQWDISSRRLSVNNGPAYVTEFAGMEVLQGGSMRDIFHINTQFSGTLNGGAGDDFFLIESEGSATMIIGGTQTTNDVLDIRGARNNLRVAVDEIADADVRVTGVESLIANSPGGHTLIGRVGADNAWVIESENAGVLNSVIQFEGFANLTGGNLVDQFIFTADSNITGIINGGQGTDSVNLTERDENSVQVLGEGDTAVAGSINVLSIENLTAAGNSTLVASNLESNTWRITDT